MMQNECAAVMEGEELTTSRPRADTPTQSREDTQANLQRLESELIDMIAEHVDESAFWSAFEGEAQWIRGTAALKDLELVDARLRTMLAKLGLTAPPEMKTNGAVTSCAVPVNLGA